MGLKGLLMAGSVVAEIALHACEGMLVGAVGVVGLLVAWGHLCLECPWFHRWVNHITGCDLPEQPHG